MGSEAGWHTVPEGVATAASAAAGTSASPVQPEVKPETAEWSLGAAAGELSVPATTAKASGPRARSRSRSQGRASVPATRHKVPPLRPQPPAEAPPATLTEQEPPQADAEPRRRRFKKRRARRSASRSAEQEARFSVNAVRIQRHGEHDPGARSPADAPQQEWVALIASPQHQQRPPLVPSVCQHTVSRPLRASWSGWQIEGHEAWLEVAMRGKIAVVWQRLWANTTVCKPGLLGVACGARPGEFDDGSACRFLHCQPAVSHPSSAFRHLAARKLWERF